MSCALQEQGWCHGDISADNVVMSTPDGQPLFTLIDFGFTTRLGETFVCRTTNLFTGATSALQDNLACAVNDVESLMYVLIELAGFKLPWAAAVKSCNKISVSSSHLASLVQDKTNPLGRFSEIEYPGAGPCQKVPTGAQCYGSYPSLSEHSTQVLTTQEIISGLQVWKLY